MRSIFDMVEAVVGTRRRTRVVDQDGCVIQVADECWGGEHASPLKARREAAAR